MNTIKTWTALLVAATQPAPAFAGDSWSVNGSTGTLFYEYEFGVPAARGRYQPQVLLRYGGTLGAPAGNGGTWAIPALPTIRYEDVNLEDPPHGDFQKIYRYADHQNPDKILLPSPRDGVGHFNADLEDAYGNYWQPDASTWCSRDASGNVSRFEIQNGSYWSLTQVVDPDGNVTKYTYDWYTRPLSIQYNVYGPPPPPGPSDCPAVTADFATEIAIEYQNPDSGFVTNVRIKSRCPISASCPDGVVTARRYGLSYEQKNVSWYLNEYPWRVDYTLDLLQTITEFGGETGVARPPMSFDYVQVGNDQDYLVKGAHLWKTTTPLGAVREFIWYDASQFGVLEDYSYPVVRSVTTTGPGLAPQMVEYGYAGATGLPTYYWVQSYHPKGNDSFRESWETDSTSGIVKHTWWERAGGYAFAGLEARIEYGTRVQPDSFPTWTSYTPPTYSTFRIEAFENVARPITASTANPTCTTVQAITGQPGYFATQVPATSYPVMVFRQKVQSTTSVDSVQLSAQRSVACAYVDTWGNVHKSSVDPDANYAGDDFLENTSFEVSFNAAAGCKNCVREKTKTDPTKSAPDDRLEATYFSYGPTYQVTSTYRQTAAVLNPTNYLGTSSYPRVNLSVFNSDGTLQSRTEGAITTSYAYDSYRLRPLTVSVADTNSTLTTTTTYDDFGRPSSVVGSAVSGRADPVQTKYFAYDALGRTKVVSLQPMSGSLVQGAIQAFDYIEASGAVPASTKTYDFTVPRNYTDPVPQAGDVRQTIEWIDGLGRQIQVRQRMGDPASGTPDPAAGIAQNVSQYRVVKAIRYDGAGRVTASIQPYYSASGGYVELTNASAIDAIMNPAQSVRADLTSYDAQGRVSCTVTRSAVSLGSASVPAVGTCTSSFAENENYARAALTTYRGVTVGGKNYLAVKTLPPENNYSGGPMLGPESFSDSAGLLRWTTDAEGNTTRLAYDLIGRQTKTTREMTTTGGGSLSPPTRPTTIDTTLTLDLMGRTVQRTDLNIGRRTFVFDDATSATLPVTIRFDKTGEEIRYTYDKGRIKETQVCTKTGGVLGCTVDSTVFYDEPYPVGAPPEAPPPNPTISYEYTAGRVSYATNQNTTIAFGYDQTGSIVRRDQWFAGIAAGGFGSGDTPRLDGQSVASGLTTPYGDSSYALWYDSSARPVQLSNGGIAYWAATGSAPTGAYDALGQLGSASLDGALVNQQWVYRVTQSWTYAPSSALLSSERVRFGTAGADVYRVDNLRYRGMKLESFVDTLSSTTYGYWYSNVGRLVAAKATPGGPNQLAQNTLVCLTYNATKAYVPGPSLGNIERTREGVSSPYTSDYSYSGTNVETGTASPHAGGPDAPASAGSTALGYDDYGRIMSTGGGAETFGYDLLGRMTSITRQGGTSEKLFYDPFGALVQRQVGSTVYSYVGKRATVTGTLATGCQTPSCGVVVSAVDVHVTLGTRRIASVRVYPAASPRTLYYYRDRLGSVVATTLDGGRSGASYRYSAYGALEIAVGESSDSASEIGYTAGLKLSGGLLSMGARVYNPALKIWMQPDPLQPFKYDYADGDPVNKIDPQGLWAAGLSLELSFIQPFTSGGGGAYGVNVEYTSTTGLRLYTYSTPNDYVSSAGFLVGVAGLANVAMGDGAWTGPFDSGAGSYGPGSLGYFHSPLEGPDAGYFGLSGGFGRGLPGVGFTRTNYTERWNISEWWSHLTGNDNVSLNHSGEATINTDAIDRVVISERSILVQFEDGSMLLIDKDSAQILDASAPVVVDAPEQSVQ